MFAGAAAGGGCCCLVNWLSLSGGEHCVDGCDPSVLDDERVDGDLRVARPVAVQPDDETRIAVHQDRFGVEARDMPGGQRHQAVQETPDLGHADQRPAGRVHSAGAVRRHDHVRCEKLGEPNEVTARQRVAQLAEHCPAQVCRYPVGRVSRFDPPAATGRVLAGRSGRAAEHLCDPGEVEAEHVVQHDSDALFRRKLVQHHEERQPNRLVGNQLLQRIRLGLRPADRRDQRLRKPRPGV